MRAIWKGAISFGLINIPISLSAATSKKSIRAMEKSLALETMYFADEIRPVEGFNLEDIGEKIKISAKEEELAIEIINNLTADFRPGKYTDDYREELLKIIREKIEGKEVETPEKSLTDNKVLDLMERLKASVEASEKQAQEAREGKKAGTG
ncbi:MAG: hypothetical protein WBK53_07845 [Halanaerobiales bacterium]